jgi:hypothetical protein
MKDGGWRMAPQKCFLQDTKQHKMELRRGAENKWHENLARGLSITPRAPFFDSIEDRS